MIKMTTKVIIVAATLFLGSAAICSATCALNVYVEDSEGNPVANATVTVSGPSGELLRITDEYGEAVFNNLQEGWYYIEVTKNSVTVYDEVYVDDSRRRRHIVLLG